MQLAQQILFIVLAAVAVWLFLKQAKAISRNIKLGREERQPRRTLAQYAADGLWPETYV